MNDKLALDGGEPAVPEHLVAHDWERFRKSTPEEIDAVVEVLKSGHLSIAMGKGMPKKPILVNFIFRDEKVREIKINSSKFKDLISK